VSHEADKVSDPAKGPRQREPVKAIREHLATVWASSDGLAVLSKMVREGSGVERIATLEQVLGRPSQPIQVSGELDQRLLIAAGHLPEAVADALALLFARVSAAPTDEPVGLLSDDRPAT